MYFKGDSGWTQVGGTGQKKKKGQAMIKSLKFSATFPILQRRDREWKWELIGANS